MLTDILLSLDQVVLDSFVVARCALYRGVLVSNSRFSDMGNIFTSTMTARRLACWDLAAVGILLLGKGRFLARLAIV